MSLSQALKYRPEIDGLRALAVVPVILFHAGFSTFSGGYIGVDIFFVISGYLITSILLVDLRAGNFSITRFYERRARRILPALLFVMLVCLPFAWFWLLPNDMKAFSDALMATCVFISNIVLWRTDDYFDVATKLKPLIHTWSLSVEEQFYLFFPLLLTFIWRFARRYLIVSIVGITLLSLIAADWGSIHKAPAAFYLLPTRAWELLFGALTAIYLFHYASMGNSIGNKIRNGFYSSTFSSDAKSQIRVISLVQKWLEELGSLLGIGLIAYAIFGFDIQTRTPSFYTLIPTLGTVFIIIFASPKSLVGKVLASPVMVSIGLISYSAYLWHQPVFAFARQREMEEPSLQVMGLLSLGVFGLALLSWKYIETPFRDKVRFTRSSIIKYGVILSLALMIFGFVGHITQGFLYRYSAQDQKLASLDRYEAGKYVSSLFNQHLLKPFDATDSRRKILIIGDSYSQDLVNALQEGGFLRHIQISTRHISHLCGNLFIPQKMLIELSNEPFLPMCKGEGIYEDVQLRKLMQSADEIWFASMWHQWQAKNINQSIVNIEQLTNKPIKIFGTKDFGEINLKALIKLSDVQKIALRQNVNLGYQNINELMKSKLPITIYVDSQKIICGSANVCQLFDDRANLLSFDGWHLTRAGAVYFGLKLSNNEQFKGLLSSATIQ